MKLQEITAPPITHIRLVKYAGASGDFNPLHTIVPFAQEVGFKDVIAHGMLVMGLGGQAITTWFPNQKVGSYSARFKRPTYVEEQLIISGEINEVNEQQQVGILSIRNLQGEEKISATFTIMQ